MRTYVRTYVRATLSFAKPIKIKHPFSILRIKTSVAKEPATPTTPATPSGASDLLAALSLSYGNKKPAAVTEVAYSQFLHSPDIELLLIFNNSKDNDPQLLCLLLCFRIFRHLMELIL